MIGKEQQSLKIKEKYHMLPSGISITSLSNTLTTLMMWYNVICDMREPISSITAYSYTKEFIKYGYTVTMPAIRNRIEGATFLKQIFLMHKTSKQIVAVNVLGMTTRFGTIKNSVNQTYHKGSQLAKCLAYMHDQVVSFKARNRNPIEQMIFQNYNQHVINKKGTYEVCEQRVKFEQQGFAPVLDHEAIYKLQQMEGEYNSFDIFECDLDPLCIRYGLTTDELQSYCDALASLAYNGFIPKEDYHGVGKCLHYIGRKIQLVDYCGKIVAVENSQDCEFEL